MEEFLREYVEDIPGTYAYPYMARITGEDPAYHFRRVFLRYEDRSPAFSGRWYTFRLPCEGVYERCVKRFRSLGGKLLSRDYDWFVFFDGEFYHLNREEVLFALWNLNAQMQPPSWQRKQTCPSSGHFRATVPFIRM